MFKLSLIVCACICLPLFNVNTNFAQEMPVVSKVINGGVINGKAKSLVLPQYPAAAKAVNAAGAVNVQVTIDEEGNVVSAAATSGHPLLRPTAVQAARQSKFTPTVLSGIPVKVTGVIVYNFVSEEMGFLPIGFELAKAEFLSAFDYNSRLYQVQSALPKEWTAEKQQTEKLIAKLHQEMADARKSQANAQNEARVYREAVNEVSAKIEEVQGTRQEIATALIKALKERLANDGIRSWEFSLGVVLGKIDAQLDDDLNLKISLNELNQLLAVAPAQASADYVAKLKELASIADKAEISQTDKAKFKVFLNEIR